MLGRVSVSEGVERRATFAEFGVAVVDEVLTPPYLEARLNAALKSLLRTPAWLSGFPAALRSARATGTRVVADDGQERRFAVTVRAELAAEVGPRALALGIDTGIEMDLTVRVHAFRPAIIGIEIDPVVADDVRISTSARSDWLPRALLDDGGSRLAGTAQRSAPLVVAAVNRALATTSSRRQVDVLDRIHRSGNDTAEMGDPVHTGLLGPGERLELPLELGDQEQARMRLWAGFAGGGVTDGGVRLEVVGTDGSSTDGTVVAATTLPVHRHAPDLDAAPAPVTVPAAEAAGYRVRLGNDTGRPVTYRVTEARTVVPGVRIGFAEFGAVLVERGITREAVGDAVARQLARHEQSMFAAPALVRGTATPRLVEVSELPTAPDELRFGLTLDIELELIVGPGTNATALAATLRAEVPLRITTTVGPAGLRLEFAPVAATDLRVVAPPRRVGGRYLPIPQRKLTELLPGRVAAELNRRLGQAGRRIVAAEVAGGPPPEFTEPQILLRSRTEFSGTTSTGEPAPHPVRLAEGQRIQATARIDAPDGPNPDAPAPDGPASDGRELEPAGDAPTGDAPTVELAVCDEHGGVWATDRAPVPADGPVRLELHFTAPETGQWRLRVTSDGPTDLGYRIRVRPVRTDQDDTGDEPDDDARTAAP